VFCFCNPYLNRDGALEVQLSCCHDLCTHNPAEERYEQAYPPQDIMQVVRDAADKLSFVTKHEALTIHVQCHRFNPDVWGVLSPLWHLGPPCGAPRKQGAWLCYMEQHSQANHTIHRHLEETSHQQMAATSRAPRGRSSQQLVQPRLGCMRLQFRLAVCRQQCFGSDA
jgi:hypothetical protein